MSAINKLLNNKLLANKPCTLIKNTITHHARGVVFVTNYRISLASSQSPFVSSPRGSHSFAIFIPVFKSCFAKGRPNNIHVGNLPCVREPLLSATVATFSHLFAIVSGTSFPSEFPTMISVTVAAPRGTIPRDRRHSLPPGRMGREFVGIRHNAPILHHYRGILLSRPSERTFSNRLKRKGSEERSTIAGALPRRRSVARFLSNGRRPHVRDTDC